MIKFKSSGQALLIVVLVVVVALTVGLSVALRTITTLRIANENESSERAFSAAEAGIEETLVTNTSVPNTQLENDTSYKTDISALSGSEINLNNDSAVLKNEPVDVWLSTYPSFTSPWSGNLSINWGNASDECNPNEARNSMAGLELIVVNGSVANPLIESHLLDPCSSRASNNQFEFISTPGDNINGRKFAYKKVISISGGLIMRVIPLYSDTNIAVKIGSTDPNLPSQGSVITSTGSSGGTVRKIVTYQSNPKLPAELFPFVFFLPK